MLVCPERTKLGYHLSSHLLNDSDVLQGAVFSLGWVGLLRLPDVGVVLTNDEKSRQPGYANVVCLFESVDYAVVKLAVVCVHSVKCFYMARRQCFCA